MHQYRKQTICSAWSLWLIHNLRNSCQLIYKSMARQLCNHKLKTLLMQTSSTARTFRPTSCPLKEQQYANQLSQWLWTTHNNSSITTAITSTSVAISSKRYHTHTMHHSDMTQDWQLMSTSNTARYEILHMNSLRLKQWLPGLSKCRLGQNRVVRQSILAQYLCSSM